MDKFFQRKYALTAEGGKGLRRSTLFSFLMYILDMVPVMILAWFLQGLLLTGLSPWWHYGLASLAVGVFMYYILNLEYDAMFSATYKESARLRTDLCEILARLPLSYFSKHNLSDLSQTIMADVEDIEHQMSHAMPKLYAFILFAPIMACMLLIGSLPLGLAVVLPVSLSFILLVLSVKTQIRGNEKIFRLLRENSEAFQESIELHQEIQSFDMQEETEQNLYERIAAREKLVARENTKAVLIYGGATLVGYLTIPALLIVGIALIRQGTINVFYLMMYLIAGIKVKDIADMIVEQVMAVLYVKPKVDTIRGIRESEVQEGQNVELSNFDISLDRTAFSYDGENQVLADTTFTAKQGEVTALVGASGCGKTSILRLVSRLYDATGGKISVGQHDISTISTDSLFSRVSIVFQDVTLFNTSVMENIRIGRPEATDTEVIRAAEMAQCADFVDRLPDGYQTAIGENGAELSGGERQRLSIARAFLKDAPILLLDEIAASLDVDNEEKIQKSLNSLVKGKTVIIISHRLKSIEGVDHIVVMGKGRVEAQGKHEELLSTSPTYTNLMEKTRMAEEFVY
ncbi:MAG: ABC transporter ATP-binding protein [Bacteroidetes bacterium]|nr:MAG: ABC transporter ATP-binding protein [Bacteroidota bacterium]